VYTYVRKHKFLDIHVYVYLVHTCVRERARVYVCMCVCVYVCERRTNVNEPPWDANTHTGIYTE